MVAALAIAITGTTATAAHAEPSTSELTKKIDKASDQLEDVVESYNKMNISLKQTKDQEKKLAASLGPAKAALEAAGSQMDAIAASAYKTGNIGTMNVVLEGADNLMDRMSILEQISRSRGRDIAEYRATTENFAERQAALKATQKKQEAEAKALNARKKKIEGDLKKLYAMRTAAYGSPTEKSSKYTGNIPSIAGSAGKAVTFAYNALGVMYDYGADGPDGYDCSGLTSAAWRAAGKSLPHNAAAQYSATTRISRSELKPGDLVFYRSNGHVGIYVGGGQIIDASRAGQPVKKRTIDIMTPNGYGRVT
ncbi:NlpC/P60 family protein [Actinoplanes sp. NPDC048791]|uniref:C40 family peptidase n=1 Tax=Actinoplanes sp. NPDC048791 TaxID=3154623 RepID=UPI003400371F